MRSKKLITYQERGEVYTKEDIEFLKEQRESKVTPEDRNDNRIGPRKEDGSFNKGGSVINAKSLRNYSRGGARKNR